MDKESSASSKAIFIVFSLFAIATAIGFSLSWRPEVASAHGADLDAVITYLLITTGVIFLVGHFVLGYLASRFREENAADYKPVSRKVEWGWAAAPFLLFTVIAEIGVIAMGTSVWQELYGETPEGAREVEVTGKQFEWIVRYPGKDGKFGRTLAKKVHATRNPLGLDKNDPDALDDIVFPISKNNPMRLPIDQAVVIKLRSQDVLHSFTVPLFRVKQDLIPGLTTKIQFRPIKSDTFEIACAELCGLGHYRMQGWVKVEAQKDFNQWLAKQKGWFE